MTLSLPRVAKEGECSLNAGGFNLNLRPTPKSGLNLTRRVWRKIALRLNPDGGWLTSMAPSERTRPLIALDIQIGRWKPAENYWEKIRRGSRRPGIGAGGVGAPNRRSKNEGPDENDGPDEVSLANRTPGGRLLPGGRE